MSLSKFLKNKFEPVRDHTPPYHCEVRETPDELWWWLDANVDQDSWWYDTVYENEFMSVHSAVWFGFTNKEDYIRFCLTWI